MVKIAILGTGNVGKALFGGIKNGSNEVKFGSRDPSKSKAPEGAEVVTMKEAVQWAEVIIFAVPHHSTSETINSIGGDNFNDKIVIDVTNALNEKWELAMGFDTSAAEEMQKLIPGAKVVKAFNYVFAENMSNGKVGEGSLTLFVASDDSRAKEVVMKIGNEIGFESVDAGPLKSARYLEPLGMLLIGLGMNQKLGTKIGFKLLK